MRKAERLFQLLTLLRSKRGVTTASELAAELQVSERTIYRDMQALSLSNMPIESEAGVGYRLRPGFDIPPLMFEEEELEALLLGINMVKSWADDALADAANQAMHKIQSALPESLHRKLQYTENSLLVPDFHRQRVSQYSSQLRHAIKQKYQVCINYQTEAGKQSQREIWPLGLVYWGMSWTLIAWCQLRDDYRMFRLDRIQQCQLSDIQFETNDSLNLQHYLELQGAKHKP